MLTTGSPSGCAAKTAVGQASSWKEAWSSGVNWPNVTAHAAVNPLKDAFEGFKKLVGQGFLFAFSFGDIVAVRTVHGAWRSGG
jgi:hypothetical protein